MGKKGSKEAMEHVDVIHCQCHYMYNNMTDAARIIRQTDRMTDNTSKHQDFNMHIRTHDASILDDDTAHFSSESHVRKLAAAATPEFELIMISVERDL